MTVLDRPAPPPDLTLRYGPHPDALVDVRLPAASRHSPLVVVVHGGFWRAAYDRTHAGPQCVALAARGAVVAAIEYRRVGSPGGGWPGTLDDVAAATDAVAGLVVDALGDRVEADRTVLVGHSAGGHLALWAASRHRLDPASPWHRPTPLPVRGVVALAGVCDLALAASLGLGGGATQALLGGSPDERPERYAAADPAALAPAGVPVRLVHGRADDVVPVALSRSYAFRTGAALDELDGVGHFELIDPLTPAWPRVLAAVDVLLA